MMVPNKRKGWFYQEIMLFIMLFTLIEEENIGDDVGSAA